MPYDFALDTLTRIAESFKRSSFFIDRDALSRLRPDDVKVHTPQIKHVQDYLPRLSIVEYGPDFSFDVDRFYQQAWDADTKLTVEHELRVTVSSASFVRHEFVDVSDLSLRKPLEHVGIAEDGLLNLVMSESPLEKLMTRLEEMSKTLALEKKQEVKKWRRREFVITKDSPIFSFQGLLANLPEQRTSDDAPLSATTTLVPSPSPNPPPYSKGDLPTSPLPDQPHSHSYRSPIHEKRKCRQFIRDLVRKVFPTTTSASGGGGRGDSGYFEHGVNDVSRWSCSTGDSDWTAISTSGSMYDTGGGGGL